MIRMTRRVGFSAAHSDWITALSAQENLRLFGPAASPEPHGHNFLLDVTVAGEIDPRTGILVNIKEIDRVVRERVVSRLDGRFLPAADRFFCDRTASVGNLLEFTRRQLQGALPDAIRWEALRLEDSDTNSATWRRAEERSASVGEVEFTRVYEFSASHRLHSPHLSESENRELFGKCNYKNGHGHNYVLEVTVGGPLDPRTGRCVAPEEMDALVDAAVIRRYDHRHLNYDVPEYEGLVTSSEVVTKVIFDTLKDQFTGGPALRRVLLRETPRNFFEYRGEDVEG